MLLYFSRSTCVCDFIEAYQHTNLKKLTLELNHCHSETKIELHPKPLNHYEITTEPSQIFNHIQLVASYFFNQSIQI